MAPYTTQVAPYAGPAGPAAPAAPMAPGANMQRDAITQALLNVQNPPPRTQVPPGVQSMGAPIIPSPAGAMGAQPGQQPGAGGMPGAPGAIPGMGNPMSPMPTGMNQTLQPGAAVPAGPNFNAPPQVGIPPQPQTAAMATPPTVGGGSQQPPQQY